MKVLWIEDQAEENIEFIELVQKRGDDVVSARTVEVALAYLEKDLYDCIVLDLKIPLGPGESVADLFDEDFNGIHVVDHLEREGLLNESKVVCLTNFVPAANSLLDGKPVKIISKSVFLREFEEVIYESK